MPQSPGVITGNAVIGFQARAIILAIETHLKFNGQLRLARNATPSNLRTLASGFTGRTYARSRKGMESALADLKTLAAGRSLDELGEVYKVNQAVGGVAADLQEEAR